MFYAIIIFREQWYELWVQKALISISWNDSKKTKARIQHHNFLVATKNLLFANEIDLLCIRSSRGKNLYHGEMMKVENDIAMRESLLAVQKPWTFSCRNISNQIHIR